METHYDICIIGSGPAGLASLSCIQEDYSIDVLSDTQTIRANKHIRQNRQSKRVCVVDPNPLWLSQWENNFQTLDISFLRSPASAHCSYFDRNALIAYAISERREDELFDSGISEIKSLNGTVLPQIGAWKLPSTKLFIDFSRSLAKSLSHEYYQGNVVGIQKEDPHDETAPFRIELDTSDEIISAKSVILATGTCGNPIIPQSVSNAPPSRIFQWQQLDLALSTLKKSSGNKSKQILVIGGGLTAVQTAHKIARSTRSNGQVGAKVILCSRKDLVERHFDIPVKWFDEREARIHQSQFYYEPKEQRLEALKATRGGGTVPPLYMNMTRNMERNGLLSRKIGDLSIVKENDDGSMIVRVTKKREKKEYEEFEVEAIVCACGMQPNCLSHPLVQMIHMQLPVDIFGGFPVITAELRWAENLYVVGGLASLSVGPDAGNLMGISRAAEAVANELNSKQWIRGEDSNVLSNPFDMLGYDTDSSSEDEEYDETFGRSIEILVQ